MRNQIGIGSKFGALTVLREAEPVVYGEKKHSASLCLCKCGAIKIVVNNHLRRGRTKSCGCLRHLKKGRAERYICKGYVFVYCPRHRHADSAGYVKEHRLIMEKHLGRELRAEEIVHHKDRNRSNNDISNLRVVSRHEHSMIHARIEAEEKGYVFIEEKHCKRCGKKISKCSDYCVSCRDFLNRKVERPTKEQLEQMITNMPFTDIAKKYGVSDKAIRKWALRYGIDVKCRLGYWMKHTKKAISDSGC